MDLNVKNVSTANSPNCKMFDCSNIFIHKFKALNSKQCCTVLYLWTAGKKKTTFCPNTFDRALRSHFFIINLSTDPKFNKAKEKAPVDCTVCAISVKFRMQAEMQYIAVPEVGVASPVEVILQNGHQLCHLGKEKKLRYVNLFKKLRINTHRPPGGTYGCTRHGQIITNSCKVRVPDRFRIVDFWASRIRIRNCFYWSGSGFLHKPARTT